MNNVTRSLAALTGVAITVGTAYLFDPDSGADRRSRLGSQFKKAGGKINERSREARDGLSHRYHQASARAVSWYDARKSPDNALARRVRIDLWRTVAHPAAIGVIAHDGAVILHGDVLASEHEQVLKVVRSVQGVGSVTDHLAEVTALEPQKIGERVRLGFVHARDDLAQPQWSTSTRMGTGALGLGLLRWGVQHRNLYGGIGALAGVALLVRSVFNTPLPSIGARVKEDTKDAIDSAGAAIKRGERAATDVSASIHERRERVGAAFDSH